MKISIEVNPHLPVPGASQDGRDCLIHLIQGVHAHPDRAQREDVDQPHPIDPDRSSSHLSHGLIPPCAPHTVWRPAAAPRRPQPSPSPCRPRPRRWAHPTSADGCGPVSEGHCPGGPWNRTTGISRPAVETIPIAPPVLLPGDAQLPDRERPGEPDSVGCPTCPLTGAERGPAGRAGSSPTRWCSGQLGVDGPTPRPAYPGSHTGTSPARWREETGTVAGSGPEPSEAVGPRH